MRPTVSQYAEALEALSEEGVASIDLAQNFLGLLRRRGESDKANSVVEQLEKRALLQTGEISVVAVTAHEQDDATKELLKKQVERIFSGKTIKFSYWVDTSVIGGAQFRTDEVLYDATISAKLGALRKVIHT